MSAAFLAFVVAHELDAVIVAAFRMDDHHAAAIEHQPLLRRQDERDLRERLAMAVEIEVPHFLLEGRRLPRTPFRHQLLCVAGLMVSPSLNSCRSNIFMVSASFGRLW
jgi:hypothetical protein